MSRQPAPAGRRRILIIRGSPLKLLAPACDRISAKFPGCSLELLDPAVAPALCPASCATIIHYDRKRLSPLAAGWGWIGRLRKERYDEVVLLWGEREGWNVVMPLVMAGLVSPGQVWLAAPEREPVPLGPFSIVRLLLGRILFWMLALPAVAIISLLLFAVAIVKGKLPDGPIDSHS